MRILVWVEVAIHDEQTRIDVDGYTFDIPLKQRRNACATLVHRHMHMHAMMAVGQKFGAPGESAYHQVFGRLVADVGGNGAPVDLKADEHVHHMKGMDMKGMGMPMALPTAPHAPR